MLMPKQLKLNLTTSQKIEFISLHKKCKERKIADKIKSILLLNDDFSCQEVAKILLLDDDTIRNYRTTFLNQGIEALMATKHKGTQGFLTFQQLKELDDYLDGERGWPNKNGLAGRGATEPSRAEPDCPETEPSRPRTSRAESGKPRPG